MKYTDEQLKEIANLALAAKQNNDPRYFQFIMTVCMATGMSAAEVEQRTRELAK